MGQTNLRKMVIYDCDGFVIGDSDTLIGCCRQLARNAVGDPTWLDVKNGLVDKGSGVYEIEIQLKGADTPCVYEIALNTDVERITSVTHGWSV